MTHQRLLILAFIVAVLLLSDGRHCVRAAVDCGIVSSCMVNNFLIIKNLLQETSAVNQNKERMDRNETEARIGKICSSFQPIIDCTGREAAVQCQFKIGKRGQVFRLYYLVVLCEITVKLRKCGEDMLAARNFTTRTPCPGQTTTNLPMTSSVPRLEKSVCSDQFPDVENQTEYYRNGITTPTINADDPYASTDSAVDDVAGMFLSVGEKCDRLRLYVGCWLHYTKDMCENEAGAIIQHMYEIYNDLSGRQCSTESSGMIDYGAFEQEYVKIYGAKTTPAPCGGGLTSEPAFITTTAKTSSSKNRLAGGSSQTDVIAKSNRQFAAGGDNKVKRTTTPAFETYEDSDSYRDGTGLSMFSSAGSITLYLIAFSLLPIFTWN